MTTTEEMIAVMQHYADGGDVEFTIGNDPLWAIATQPNWDWPNVDYRIAVTKPSIDWSHVSDEYNALATDSDGETWMYGVAPRMMEGDVYGCWVLEGGIAVRAISFSSFRTGTCDWRDSLVIRPGYEGI